MGRQETSANYRIEVIIIRSNSINIRGKIWRRSIDRVVEMPNLRLMIVQ